MFATDDTIVAIATPPGPGAIGIVRLSGAQADDIAAAMLTRRAPLEPRRATLVTVVDPARGRAIDRVLATAFPAPRSYTGESMVEISAHGSPVVLRQIVTAAVEAGARLAAPGEFTFRAFLHGRIDLVQAEAVGDLVDAATPMQAQVAFGQLEGGATAAVGAVDRQLFDLMARLEASLDFPDEGYHFIEARTAGGEAARLADDVARLRTAARRGRLIREGCQAAVLGRPNVGKSTLFNLLCGAPRAIVTASAGTTRDLLTETIDVGGMPVTLVDTAGIRAAADPAEVEGVRRTRGALAGAAAGVVVLDRSQPLGPDDEALIRETAARPRVVVASKIDRPAAWSPAAEPALASAGAVVEACLLDPGAADPVRAALARALDGGEPLRDVPAISNIRHITLLGEVEAALRRAAAAAADGAAEELVLADLQEARRAVEEMAGTRTPEAVLDRIFERFCIGK